MIVIEGAPAGDFLIHHSGVVDNAQGAPGVGDGIPVFRVVRQVFKPVVNEAEVGNLAVVQRFQHIFRNETADHIVGGNNYIVVRSAAAQQGVERLITFGGLVIDPDTGLFLELGD